MVNRTEERPARRGRGVVRLLGSLAGLVGTGAVVVFAGSAVYDRHTQPQHPGWWPSPQAGVADTRLLPPVTGPAGEGGFALTMVRSDGSPVRYDPCRPIRYVVNPHRAPDGGTRLVRAAVAEVSKRTGLVFSYEGTTNEFAVEERDPVQPNRYGDRWAPVLIQWATEADTADLAGPLAGAAGSTAVGTREPSWYVTGMVTLDRDQVTWPAGDRRAKAKARAIVMHELGHLVGLNHIEDTTQLMYDEASFDRLAFAPGDLRGLARVGAGGCAPIP